MKSKSINKGTRGRGRVAKACAQCRFAKTRCDITYGAAICTRCAERGIDCEPLEPDAKLRKGDLPKKPAVFVKHPADDQDFRSMNLVENEFNSGGKSQLRPNMSVSENPIMRTANTSQYYYFPPEDDYQSVFMASQPSFERSWDREAAARLQRDQFSDRKSDLQQKSMTGDDNMISSNFNILLSAAESHASAVSTSDAPPLLTPPEPQSFFYNPLQGQTPDFTDVYPYYKRSRVSRDNKIASQRAGCFNYPPSSNQTSLHPSRNSSQDSQKHSTTSQGTKDLQPKMFSATLSFGKTLMTPNSEFRGFDPQDYTLKSSADKSSGYTENDFAFDTAFSPYQSLYDSCQSGQALVSGSESLLQPHDKKTNLFVGDEGVYCQNAIEEGNNVPSILGCGDSSMALTPNCGEKPKPDAPKGTTEYQGTAAKCAVSNASFAQTVLYAMYKHLIERITLSPSYISPRKYMFPSNLNLITADAISREGAIKLFEVFRETYDDWLEFPHGEAEVVLDHILGQCPLLATACCSVALRFGNDQFLQPFYPNLIQFLSMELAETLKNPPMNTECVQALTILSKYADSLCYNNHVFDMWRISASGIRHIEAITDRLGMLTYTYLRLWNQVVLAHICSANITGREIIISKAGVEICAKILDAPCLMPTDNVTVAEVNIMWHTNRYMSHEIPFLDYEKEVQLWRNQWSELKHLPVIQFIEPMLRFCLLLTQWVHAYRCSPSDQPVNAQGRPSHSWNKRDSEDNPTYGRESVRFMAPRTPYPQRSYLSSIHSVMLEDSMQCMVTRDLINELLNLNSVISSLIYRVEPRQFMRLSDNLRQVGFLCGVMALVACKILITREPVCYQAMGPLETCNSLIRKLAHRFKMSSRSLDMASTQTSALLELLETVHWPPPQVTAAYPSIANA